MIGIAAASGLVLFFIGAILTYRRAPDYSFGRAVVFPLAGNRAICIAIGSLGAGPNLKAFTSNVFNSPQGYRVRQNWKNDRRNRVDRTASWFVLGAFLFSSVCSSAATLDDLKRLPIICFVPSYLPQGFRLKTVEITDDEPGPDEPKRPFPLYSLEYENDQKATFSIESAREGIGDRNIMEDEENAEETEIKTPLGPMYLIYRPKGKEGRKDEIKANWVEDNNTKAENAKDTRHPVLGRFHGISATGITLAEFANIVQSLHSIREDKGATPAAAQTSALKIHPKVFSMINSWISDSESPVVTEVNLDAVEKNGNEFNQDGLKQDGEWWQCPVPDANGFMRYRVLESKGNHYKVEYQENGGGTLTTAAIIEFDIETGNIRRNGKPVTLRVLHVSACEQK